MIHNYVCHIKRGCRAEVSSNNILEVSTSIERFNSQPIQEQFLAALKQEIIKMFEKIVSSMKVRSQFILPRMLAELFGGC
jgi:hypothetical protein